MRFRITPGQRLVVTTPPLKDQLGGLKSMTAPERRLLGWAPHGLVDSERRAIASGY